MSEGNLSEGPEETRGLPCKTCGGVFPVVELSVEVTCPFCHDAQVVSPELFQTLGAYERQVSQKLHRAGEQELYAELWERRFGEKASTRGKWVLASVVGGVVLMSVAGYVSKQVGGGASTALMLLSLLAPFATIGGLFWTGRRDAALRVRRREASVLAVACPSCGAPGELGVGAQVSGCTFCGAALVPTAKVRAMGLESAQQSKRAAELARYRSEREGMGAVAKRGMNPKVQALLPAGVPCLWLLLTIVTLAVDVLRGGEGNLLLMLSICGAAMVFGGIAYWMYRKENVREEALSSAMLAVSQQLGGERTVGQKLIEWLNEYWAGGFKTGWLYGLGAHQQVSATVDGYPCLLNVGVLSRAGGGRPQVHVLVAAWVPEVSDGTRKKPVRTPEYREEVKLVTQLGFTVTTSAAGLLLHAEAAVAEKMRAEPDKARQLVTVVHHGVKMMQALGARRAEPLP